MPNLFIDIEARFAKFQDSLDRAKKQTDGFVSGISRSLAGLGRIAGPLAGIASLAGLTAAIKSTADAADELDKVSQKTGVTTEALSELKFAAEINNVTFEELQEGFKKLAVAIDANDDVFRRLGLDPKSFQGLDDALSQVADRFSQIQDPASAAALAVDLFGKSGNDLIPLLRLGKAGIEDFREEARRLGLTINSDFAKNADAFNDEIERMQAAFTGLKISIASGVLPTLTKFLEDLNRGTDIADGFVNALKLFGTINPFKSVDANIASYRKGIDDARKDLERLRAELQKPGVVGTPRLAVESQIASLEKSIQNDSARLKFLQGQQAKDTVERFSGEQFKDARDLGANNRTFTPGAKKLEKAAGSSGVGGTSDFESLKRSLTSQLQTELRLTEELILIEDKRFKALKPAQQGELRALAQRVDSLKLEKEQQETVRQTIEFEQSLRDVSERDELASIEAKKSAIKRDFEDRKLSAQEYYSFLAAEETRANEIQLRNLRVQQEIATERSQDISLPEQDRSSALLQEAEVRQRINTLIIEQTEIEQRNARAAAQADDELLDRKVAIAQQLNSLRGTPDIELDRLALERQFRDLPEEFKASITFQTFLDTTIAEQQLDQFERSAGVVEQTLRIKEERISVDQESGIKTNSEARSSIVEARQVAANELQEIITKYEEVSKASGQAFGAEQQARLESLKIKLQELRTTTDEYALAFKQVGEGPTQQFFEDFISGSVSAEDAFDKFAKSVQANLLKLTSEDLTKKLFGALNGDGSEDSGISGLLSGAAQFLGFGAGQQQPAQQPITQIGLQPTGGQGLIAPAASFAADLFSGGEEKDSSTDELSDAAASAATSLLGLSDNSQTATSSVEDFSSSFSVTDVVSKIFEYFTATAAAEAGTQALATATTTAAAQIALAGSTASASAAAGSFSADGNVFSGGYQMAFAKGGAFDHGSLQAFASGGMFQDGKLQSFPASGMVNDRKLQAFATGGIVHAPTTFPIKGGRTGLMGEAGPEAIMPLTKGAGGFQVYAVGGDGTSTTLNITRNASGKLAVKLPSSAEAGPQFAMGGAFHGGIENYVMKFADGGVFTSTASNVATVNAGAITRQSASSQSSLESIINRTDALPIRAYAYGGVARSPQVAVFGEGSRPEAFVPLPDGRSIPVTMDAQAQGITVVQNITTPDANSFRRSRAALFNDVQSGLSAAASKN